MRPRWEPIWGVLCAHVGNRRNAAPSHVSPPFRGSQWLGDPLNEQGIFGTDQGIPILIRSERKWRQDVEQPRLSRPFLSMERLLRVRLL